MWIGPIDQAERVGQQHREDLDGDSERGDLPHRHRDEPAERDERCAHVRVLFAPGTEREEEAVALNPAAHDHQREAEVERPAGLERRIERVENRGPAGQDGNRRHDETDHHHPEADPIELRVAKRATEAHDGRQREEAGDEERGPDEGVQHPVGGQALVVVVEANRLEILVEVDTRLLEGLQRSEEAADRKGEDGERRDEGRRTACPPWSARRWAVA